MIQSSDINKNIADADDLASKAGDRRSLEKALSSLTKEAESKKATKTKQN